MVRPVILLIGLGSSSIDLIKLIVDYQLFNVAITAMLLYLPSSNLKFDLFYFKGLFLIILLLIIGLIFIKIEWNINQTINKVEILISNGTIVYLSNKVCLGSMWFLIGVYSYNYLLPKSIIKIINRLSFIELFIIIFTIIILKFFIESLAYDYVVSLINDVSQYNYNWMASNKPCTCETPTLPTPSNSNAGCIDNVANGAIVTTTMAGAFKLEQQSPNIAGKLCCVCLGLVAGAGGIAVKNVVGNATANLGISKFMSNTNLMDTLYLMFNLTGNHGLDLLKISYFFQKLQFLTIILISYNLLLANINENKLEGLLLKYLPNKFVKWYIRSIIYLKKSSVILVICLLVLLLIFNYYSYYCLDFFLSNLDQIIEVYFKK